MARALDKIIIRDLLARGRIGVTEKERARPQDLLINLTLETDLSFAARSDNYLDSVDYSELTKRILAHVEAYDGLTVERLAEEIAAVCLRERKAISVTVRLEKTSAVRFVAGVGVEITRYQPLEREVFV